MDDQEQSQPPPKRAKSGRSFNEEMMALVGEYAASAPVSIAVYSEFNDDLYLDSIITRVRPGFIEARQAAPEPVNIAQPMQLLSMGALEEFLRISRDGALPQVTGVVVYTGAKSPPLKFKHAAATAFSPGKQERRQDVPSPRTEYIEAYVFDWKGRVRGQGVWKCKVRCSCPVLQNDQQAFEKGSSSRCSHESSTYSR